MNSSVVLSPAKKLLQGKELTIKKQEYHGVNYEFFNVTTVCTRAFADLFGVKGRVIASAALELLRDTYPNGKWDYLQVFEYDGTDFWIISDCPKDQPRTSESHITFLLPSDY